MKQQKIEDQLREMGFRERVRGTSKIIETLNASNSDHKTSSKEEKYFLNNVAGGFAPVEGSDTIIQELPRMSTIHLDGTFWDKEGAIDKKDVVWLIQKGFKNRTHEIFSFPESLNAPRH